MAPKQKQRDTDQGLTGPAARLRTRALALGVLASEKPPAAETLPVSKALLKCNGQDIIKKSTVRKNRYLIILNCQLAPAAAGKLGTLAQLDSNQPVMYIDSPTGRLKLFGTLVFPRNKYAVLRTGGQAGVLCEDVFESMMVFSEAWWIGTKEENPSEERLVMPFELSTTQLHQDYDHTYGAAAATNTTTQGRQPAPRATMNGSQVEAVDMTASQLPTQEVPGSANRPRRAAAKRNYAIDLDEDEDDIEDNGLCTDSEGADMDSDEEGRYRKQTTPGVGKTISTVRPSGHITALDEDVNDGVVAAPLALKNTRTGRTPTKALGQSVSTQRGVTKTSTASRGKAGGRKRKAASESEDEDVSSDISDIEDDLGVSGSDGSPASDDQDEEDNQKSESDEEGQSDSDGGKKSPVARKQVPTTRKKPSVVKTPATQARKATKTPGAITTAKGSRPAPAKDKPTTKKKRSRTGSESEEDEDAAIALSDTDDSSPAAGLSSQRPTRRAAAAKRPKYTDHEEDEEDSEGVSDDNEPSSSLAREDNDGSDFDYDGDSDEKAKPSKARSTAGKGAGRQTKAKSVVTARKSTGGKEKTARGNDTDEDDYEPIEIDLSD